MGQDRWAQSLSRIDRRWLVVGSGVIALLAWLPTWWLPASADESGFLMVASQWHEGTSLYGDYWVDRPPLLIILYATADAAGGLGALRVLGCLAVFVSVILAGLIGRLASPAPGAPLAAAATATVFMGSPLFGRGVVNGEVLALPFVLAGVAALLAARGEARAGRSAVLWAAAGAAAASAALIKQNFLDVFFVAAVMLALPVVGVLRARVGAAFVLGAGLVLALVLLVASSRGTTPAELWVAVVTFRIDANQMIGSSASSATPLRAARLGLVLVLSGAVPLLVLAARRLVRSAATDGLDIRIAAAILVAWEVLSVALGGSYWLHYLMGLVPGLVLVAALVTVSSPIGSAVWQRTSTRLLTYSAVVSLGSLFWVAIFPAPTHEDVSAYLTAHGRTGDTAVVAFGKPDILYGAGMSSPYPMLWSLPVRVLDPQLHQLARLLGSHARPTWLITSRLGLAGWGLDPSGSALTEFADNYQRVAEFEGLVVYRTRVRQSDSVPESPA
ncbi:MAG: hypothetical protein JWN68_378 [Nocardioides sp.]|jgi:predicted aconitase with swiveling domain|nr:hypothetical protein [Nocardioides sp.]